MSLRLLIDKQMTHIKKQLIVHLPFSYLDKVLLNVAVQIKEISSQGSYGA